jgi:hypothetical protein
MWLPCVRQRVSRLLTALQQVRYAIGTPARDPKFSTVNDADLKFFESVLGSGGVVTDPHELQPLNQ